MLDIGDLFSALDALERWRFMLCITVAGLLFWGMTHIYPGEPPLTFTLALFISASVVGIWWECTAYKGRRRR